MMIRLLIFLLFLALFMVIAAWFVENDGSLAVSWMGYHVQTSVAFASLAGVMLVVLLTMILQIVLFVMRSPAKWRERGGHKKREQGLTALTEGFAAIAASDARRAEQLTKQAVKALGQIPLTKLLSAQTAQMMGKRDEAKQHYMAMLEDKETELIAVKGLLVQARHEGDVEKAEFLAEKALKLRPDAAWAISSLAEIYKEKDQWQGAQKMVELALKHKLIPAEQAKQQLAVIAIAEAKKLKNADDLETAESRIKDAYKLLPHFPPVAVVYAQILDAKRDHKKAIQLVEKAWKEVQHPDIADAYMALFKEEHPEKRLLRAERLVKLAEHLEAHMAVAKEALDQQNTTKARHHLKIALSQEETSSLCKMMVRLEELEQAEADIIDQWKRRAQTALIEQYWQCTSCGHRAQAWNEHCPQCHAFDGLRYQVAE